MSIRLGGAHAAREEKPLLAPHRVAGALYVVAMFMTVMDQTIVNVALPSIARDFEISAAASAGAVVAYLVSMAVFIPAAGWIGDRLGTERALLLALTLFTTASVACALAPGNTWLVACRAVQGVGGGLAVPAATTMLYRAFPPGQRARVSWVVSMPIWLAPAAGPVLGGLLVEQLSWRWAFLLNAPIGLVAIAAGAVLLRHPGRTPAGPFDATGFVLAGAGFAGVVHAVSVAPSHGWGSALVLVTGVGGAAAIGVLVVHELRHPAPLIDLRLLADRLFRASNLTNAFGYGAFIAVVFLVPVYVQVALGGSPLDSGLVTAPEALAGVAISPVVGRLYPVVGPRRLAAGGLVLTALAAVLLARTGAGTSLWTLRALMALMGVGFTAMYISIQAASFTTISDGQTGHASSLFNAQRQLSAALGVALVASILGAAAPLATGAASGAAIVPAFHTAFLVAAGLLAVGAGLALRIRDDDARSTIVSRHAPAAAPAASTAAAGG
jgi:EmrB/QacA subfamily drug resistance transporter